MLYVTELKAFVDNKLNFGKMIISLFDIEENTVEKGENAEVGTKKKNLPTKNTINFKQQIVYHSGLSLSKMTVGRPFQTVRVGK